MAKTSSFGLENSVATRFKNSKLSELTFTGKILFPDKSGFPSYINVRFYISINELIIKQITPKAVDLRSQVSRTSLGSDLKKH